MRNPLYILRDEVLRFDGLTLLGLVVLVPSFLALPIWSFGAVIFGSETVWDPVIWIDIPARLALALFFVFFGTYRARKYDFGFERVRLSVTVISLVICVTIIALLHFLEVINIIPG